MSLTELLLQCDIPKMSFNEIMEAGAVLGSMSDEELEALKEKLLKEIKLPLAYHKPAAIGANPVTRTGCLDGSD